MRTTDPPVLQARPAIASGEAYGGRAKALRAGNGERTTVNSERNTEDPIDEGPFSRLESAV
jgi:hypothetical protein